MQVLQLLLQNGIQAKFLVSSMQNYVSFFSFVLKKIFWICKA